MNHINRHTEKSVPLTYAVSRHVFHSMWIMALLVLLVLPAGCDSNSDSASGVNSFTEGNADRSGAGISGRPAPLTSNLGELSFARETSLRTGTLTLRYSMHREGNDILWLRCAATLPSPLQGLRVTDAIQFFLCADRDDARGVSYRIDLAPDGVMSMYEVLEQFKIEDGSFKTEFKSSNVGMTPVVIRDGVARFMVAMRLPEDARTRARFALAWWSADQAGMKLQKSDPERLTTSDMMPIEYRPFSVAKLPLWEPDGGLNAEKIIGETAQRAELIRDLHLVRERVVKERQRSGADLAADLSSEELAKYQDVAAKIPHIAYVGLRLVEESCRKGEPDLMLALQLVQDQPYSWSTLREIILRAMVNQRISQARGTEIIVSLATAMHALPGIDKREVPLELQRLADMQYLTKFEPDTMLQLIAATDAIMKDGYEVHYAYMEVLKRAARLLKLESPDDVLMPLEGPYLKDSLSSVVRALPHRDLSQVMPLARNVIPFLVKHEKHQLAVQVAIEFGKLLALARRESELGNIETMIQESLQSVPPILRQSWTSQALAIAAEESLDTFKRRLQDEIQVLSTMDAQVREPLLNQLAQTIQMMGPRVMPRLTPEERDTFFSALGELQQPEWVDDLKLRAMPLLLRSALRRGHLDLFLRWFPHVQAALQRAMQRAQEGKTTVSPAVLREAPTALLEPTVYFLLLRAEGTTDDLKSTYGDAAALSTLVATLTSDNPGTLREILATIGTDRVLQSLERVDALFGAPELAAVEFQYRVRLASFLADIASVNHARAQLAKAKAALDGIPVGEHARQGGYGMYSMLPCRLYSLEGEFDDAVKHVEDLQARNVPIQGLADRVVMYRALRDKNKLEAELLANAPKDLPRIELTLESGVVVLELFEDDAPNHTANMIRLVEDGSLEGIPFHRVDHTYVVQGGDYEKAGRQPPNWAIPLEVKRHHVRGSLGMARAPDPTSANTQFYVVREDNVWSHKLDTEHRNPGYTVFGRVVSGMEAIDNMVVGTLLIKARVLSKRDHAYEPARIRR